MKKPWLPWLILVVVAAVAVYVIDSNRAVRAILKESKAQNAEYAKQIIASNERAEASEAARLADARAAAQREAVFLAKLASVQTATPQQLVDDGSRLLRATDIRISQDGRSVTMGLETWRGAVKLMLTGDEYLNEKKPAWEAQVRGYTDQIASLKESVLTYEQRVAGLEQTIKSISKLTPKKISTFEKVLWAGGGIALGMFIEKAVK